MGEHSDIDHTGLTGAGGDVATDTIFDAKGDLAVGTGANTASKLTVGANDTIPMADSGQATGIKWVGSQTPSTQAFSDSAAEGTADTYARGDHKHAMPASPLGSSLTLPEGSAPSTPSSGNAVIYVKTDGRVYSKDDAGTEYGPFDVAGGGGGPLLAIDDTALGTNGDDFASGTGGWTFSGASAGSLVTSEVYDATCYDITFPAQGDRMYKAMFAADPGECTMTIHGISNSTPSPSVARGGMLSLFFSDNSGNGTGFSVYDDGLAYIWQITANAYAANSGSIAAVGGAMHSATGLGMVYKLNRSSNIITGSVSFNGGGSWQSVQRSDGATFTRMGLIRLYTGGGTNPLLRVGRFTAPA